MANAESRTVMVAGSKVHSLSQGDEHGQVVVLLHGPCYAAKTWQKIGTMQALADAGFLAVAIDLPGSAGSEPNERSPDTWLAAVLDSLGLVKPVVVSPSTSSKYALPLVTSHPERLRAFIAVESFEIMEYEDRLNRITVPFLAVWGESGLIPQAEADLLVASVPQGRKAVIPYGTHAPYMNDCDAWHRILLDFLSELN
jgi:abhydrolase domain-containing protein 14